MTAETTVTRDYKSSVFLPRTSFPMRAGLPKREPEILARWEEMGLFDELRRQAAGREKFILHDGPPYANGHLHIGHALNKTLKDMLNRTQQMLGKDAHYVPGWDCHGLPIEWKVEERYRQEGRDKDEVDQVEFRQECRTFASYWVGEQTKEFKRLGVLGNWERPYLTMSYNAEAQIVREIGKFLINGGLYAGAKPVLWSVVEKTALADAEVEYADHTSITVWVRFPLCETQAAGLEGASVVIWTTTPWTIPSNKAVVYGDNISYGLYEITGRSQECWARIGDRYILADKRATDVMQRARLDDKMCRRLCDVSSKDLAKIQLQHPFAGADGANGEWDDIRDFRAAEFVSDEEGTGFVHCAPSHGMEEYELYRDLGMLDQVITHNVLDDGSFRSDLPFFGGKHILSRKGGEGDANKAVVDKLVEIGGLLARGKIKHSYPHSWRSKAPVIYRNTPQWFAAIDRAVGDGQDTYGTTIRERALRSIDELVAWTPKTGRNRLYSMIEARPDWVLSRQRAWGVPLTCFTKKGALPTDPDFLLRDPAVNARITEAFEAEGADAWYADGAKKRFLGNDHNPDEWDQVFDILDVWFDSGSTHAFVLRDRADGTRDGVADVYMEGTDQHRGWFHSSMLQACGTKGRAPYRNVVTHGMTLDEQGFKMSKSVGNTILPHEVIKRYGADILRLWVAQTDYTADQRIGPEILKGVADSYRRLRNTMRFMLGALADLTKADRMEPTDMPLLERWVLSRLAELDTQVCDGYLSAFYFDVRKDALYCDGDTPRRRAVRSVLDILFHRLTTWLAPILVFTMEEVWLERYPGDDNSVHLQDFPETPANWINDQLMDTVARVRRVRRVVTAALEVQRINKVIGSSLESAPVVHVADVALLELLQSIDMDDLCITSGLILSGDPSPDEAFCIPEIPGIGVVFEKAEGEKCQRCWKILPDVGLYANTGVCGRCNTALEEIGFAAPSRTHVAG
ncbi:MAG: isoleucine--tRNA ligase [Rhodobacteraceae bacterium]|nr:isoleucine--tRNA ligase [Paracoccaceae bacterium]